MKVKITPEMRISLMHAECIDLTDIAGPMTEERDALAAQIESMRYELQACQNVLHMLAHVGEVTPDYADAAKKVLQATPVACLKQVQATAVLSAVKFCNRYAAFPVSRGNIADTVIAVDELTAYAEHILRGGAA